MWVMWVQPRRNNAGSPYSPAVQQGIKSCAADR